jgi:8-hydroxy-5-deazaflavin:NADPH oxidoreductase
MEVLVDIAVVGTGFIGGIVGKALARAGNDVRFGSRRPDEVTVAADTSATVTSVAQALDGAEVVILALPGSSVPELVAEVGGALAGKLVVDATNKMGDPVANSRAALPSDVRYARAFNTLGGENLADPVFGDVRADMFFSAPHSDRPVVEELVEAVGLRPVFVGPDQEAIVDCLFRLWVALAMGQGRGRRLALHLLEGDG